MLWKERRSFVSPFHVQFQVVSDYVPFWLKTYPICSSIKGESEKAARALEDAASAREQAAQSKVELDEQQYTIQEKELELERLMEENHKLIKELEERDAKVTFLLS